MRKTTELFMIDGLPMLVPDEDMEISMEDIDASDSGRDESAVMHRFVIRRDVGKWSFSYANISQEEYAYMESLFAGKTSFQFTHPSPTDGGRQAVTTAYRGKHGILWHCAATGRFKNYQFSIIEC